MSHARTFPQAVALMDLSRDARMWTYAEMAQAAERLAAVWQGEGVRPGDRVAILLPQCAEALIAHFAAHLIGAVSLPLFVLFGPEALRFRLKDSGAKSSSVITRNIQKFAKLRLIFLIWIRFTCVRGPAGRQMGFGVPLRCRMPLTGRYRPWRRTLP